MYSVIIPAKNECDNIARCIRSIYGSAHNKNSVEIIVIDNGSTDNTVDIAKKEGASVFIKKELKIAGLRNYGSQKASNKIIVFIDADCEVGEKWLEHGYSILRDRNDIGVVGGQYMCPKKATWVQKTWDSVRPRGNHSVNFITSGNFFIKKDIFNEFGGFDENLETGEDYDLCIRVSKKYKIISDDKLNIIHYGEPATVMQRLHKEIWYGKNIKQILRKKPIYFPFWLSLIFISFVTLFLIGILLLHPLLVLLSLANIVMLLAFISFYRCLKVHNFSFFFPLIFVYFFYLMGRSISLINFFLKEKRGT